MKGRPGLNFAVTALTLFVIFGFIGYLLGQYAVAALTTHYRASRDSERAEPAAPVFVPPAVQPGAGQAHDAAPPAAVTPTPRPNETLYRVQVGVFSEKRNAERLVELLKEEGYDALVISEAAYHRVQTGAFGTEANAAKLVSELKAKGFEAIIVR
ncbi:MAG TPA: SPOR domain-containing protein [Firmicutes bacterium]|nr:SPOR domain-containing protein [Bacillota bacterium]